MKNNIRKINSLLLIILLIAAIVRYWGINFGLPHTACRPDETVILNVAVHFFSGDFNPHWFGYPSLYMYLLFGLFSCYFLFGIISGKYASLSDLKIEYEINPSNFHLIDRWFSAFLGTATVFITYKIAKHLLDKKTAVISSLFLSFAYLHARDSHFGVTDVPMTFMIMGSVLFIIKSSKDKSLKNYVIAGIFAGLATSTKYGGILLLAPMFVAHFFNTFNQQDEKSTKNKVLNLFFDKRMLLFFGALLFAFFLTTPFVLVDFSRFKDAFLANMEYVGRGHVLILGRGWWYHLKFSLFHGLGWPLFFASLAGTLILAKTNIKKAMILCSFPLVYYAYSGKGHTVFLRYIIPLIPFLCITAAVFTVYISDKLSKRLKPPLGNIITSVIASLIILPSAYNIIRFDNLLARKDNRVVAAKWINENLAEGSSIFQYGGLGWGRIQLHSATLKSLEQKYEEEIKEGRNPKTLKAKIDYFRKENIRGFEQWTPKKKTLPEYIIVQVYPVQAYLRVHQAMIDLLKRNYSLEKSFEVIDMKNKENLFDQIDGLCVPFTGFKDVQRPGPNFYIFKLNRVANGLTAGTGCQLTSQMRVWLASILDSFIKTGNIYQRRGELDKAIEQYQKALSLQPGYTLALNNLATVYAMKREHDKATSLFKKLIEVQPDSAGACYNIACIYARQNKREESIDWLKKAIEKGYKNWGLIKTDKDLENIRGSSYYKEIMRGH